MQAKVLKPGPGANECVVRELRNTAVQDQRQVKCRGTLQN